VNGAYGAGESPAIRAEEPRNHQLETYAQAGAARVQAAEFAQAMITPAEQAEAEYLEKVAETGLDPAAAFGGNSTPGAATATAAAGTMPSAPTNSAPTSTASVAAGIELDAEGLPWDKRIHSDAAERKTQKGVWKKRRGVQDAVVAQVEAELRAALAANPGAVAAPAGAVTIPPGGVLGESAVHVEPAAAPAELAQPTSVVVPQVTAQPATLTPPAPTAIGQPATLTPPAPVDTGARSFAGLMQKVLPYMQSPVNPNLPLTSRHLEEIAHRCNLINPTSGKGDINMLANRPDLLDHAYQWADYLIANPNTAMLSKA
jgi:hypothetical protein